MADESARGAPRRDDVGFGVRLCTLGTFGLYRAGGERLLGPGKPVALLAYLNALPGRCASRDHLLHTLWADLDEKSARHALRQTIWYLRQQLGNGVFVVESGRIALSAPIDADIGAFLAVVEAGRLEEAVAAYTGDFLATFVVPGGLAFEQWAGAERQRLRLLYRRALESLTRTALAQGRHRQARELAGRMRDADPLDETSWRLLIQTALAAGDRLSAATDAAGLTAMLAAEHREPEPATQAVLRQLATAPVPDEPLPSAALPADLVGRERHFAALVAAFREAARGKGRTLDIVAPAGLGKTRLLLDFARYSSASGQTAVYVRALPADRELAWSYAGEIVRRVTGLPGAVGVSPAAAASLAALDPSVTRRWAGVRPVWVPGDEGLRDGAAAVAELLRAVADERPVALLLDDLHWSDAASRNLLGRVAARLSDAPVLIVCAYRTGSPIGHGTADDLLTLDPITVEQTAALVASLGTWVEEELTPDFAARLHAAAHGSPLLILATLTLALDSGCLTLARGRWQCIDPAGLDRLLEAGAALSHRIAQLHRSTRGLLLLLSLAETPLVTDTLVAAFDDGGTETMERLHQLEHQGLVVRVGQDWSVAHDEIADQSRAAAAPEDRTAAHARLGRALLQHSTGRTGLHLAARHLAIASLDDELGHAAARWVRVARSGGDRRPVSTIIGELLGARADPRRVRALVRRLPWRLRVGAARALGIGVAGAAVLVAGALLTTPRLLPDPPVVRIAAWQREPDGAYRLYARDIGRAELTDEIVPMGSLRPTDVRSADRPAGVVQPGSAALAMTRTFADSGGEDVVLLPATGAMPRRLTWRRGDDVAGDWSPDGRYLVIQTDRWSSRSMSDLAILDPAFPDSIVQRLTEEPAARDVWPLWSPDGTRVAFVRSPLNSAPGEPGHSLCIVTSDGRQEVCPQIPGHAALHLVGWANAAEIVGLYSDSAGVVRLVVLHTVTGAYHKLAEAANMAFQSRVKGYTACFCRRDAGEPFQLMVFDVADPGRALRLVPGDPPPALELLPASDDRSYLDRLAIRRVDRPIPADVAYQLRLDAWDAAQRPVEALAVRWTSSDSSIAAVRTGGILHPRRAGAVTLWASAGGWRADSTVIAIMPARVRSEVVEEWTADFESRWQPFGEPRPYLIGTPRGRALAPNGDSTFTSGVYLRRSLATAGGIGVEFAFSAPVTSRSWQYLNVKLVSGLLGDLAQWDHRTGGLPIGDPQWRSCGIYYPHARRRDQIHLQGGLNRAVDIAPEAEHGAWIVVRLQIFPDGRCGVAVGGRPLAILPRRIPLGDSARLVIDAYSHRTQFLVGPVSVWSGVRRDVDWGVLDGLGPDP